MQLFSSQKPWMYFCLLKFLHDRLIRYNLQKIISNSYFRLGLCMIVILNSLEWKHGVLVSISIISCLIFIIPYIGAFRSKNRDWESSLVDRSNLFLPTENRMKSKLISNIFISIMLLFVYLKDHKILPIWSGQVW